MVIVSPELLWSSHNIITTNTIIKLSCEFESIDIIYILHYSSAFILLICFSFFNLLLRNTLFHIILLLLFSQFFYSHLVIGLLDHWVIGLFILIIGLFYFGLMGYFILGFLFWLLVYWIIGLFYFGLLSYWVIECKAKI